MKTKLTKEEKGILDSLEKGEWIPVADLSKRRKELAQYARNTLRKDKRLNIRVEGDEGPEPERLRTCLRCQAYRQMVHHPERLIFLLISKKVSIILELLFPF
jgi:hypothetical protein